MLQVMCCPAFGSTEEVVEDGEIVGEIRVGERPFRTLVNTVKVGRHDQKRQGAVDGPKLDVAVIDYVDDAELWRLRSL